MRISDWSSDVCSSDLPLDYANNDNSAWYGSDYRDLAGRTGFGVRQTLEGDRRYGPWVNAPPGTTQDMGVFLLPDSGDAASVTKAALAYTRATASRRSTGTAPSPAIIMSSIPKPFSTRRGSSNRRACPTGWSRPTLSSGSRT